jgi:hypothetical protein
MSGMRLFHVVGPFAVLALAVGSGGCATTLGSASGHENVVVAVDAPVTHTSNDVVEVTEVVPPVAVESAPPRRRLSQTVTLGSAEPVYAVPPAQRAAGANGGGVVVNNNITVVNAQPAVYGGYGYGGYGGYGAGYAGSSRGDGRGASSRTSTSGAWAPTGWEGAQRTAAPGHTPGVGGNFAPPPSHGPRALR